MPFWKQRQKKNSEPQPENQPRLPVVPCNGQIESFIVADAVGSILLTHGEAIRFGTSACDFEPLTGADVVVQAVEMDPLGKIRATRVQRQHSAQNEKEQQYAQPQKDVLLSPIEHRTAWSLACILERSPQHPQHARAIDEIKQELKTRRGKSQADIDEMIVLVKWAIDVLNPSHGGTAESGGRVYQIVGDYDDLEWAVEIAQRDGQTAAVDIQKIRAVIERHMG
jgi:hypothetical protein